MKALVTGGGGFLGKAIVLKLLERGDNIRSFSRGDYPELRKLGVDVVHGDISDAEEVDLAVDGSDVVFHVASKPGIWGPYEEYHRTNVEGTENIITACRNHGIKRLVYTSSPSVVHSGGNVEGIDESTPYAEHFETHYPKTKAIAEQMVLKADSEELATVSLRPHLIWGPGDNHLIPRLIQRGRSGRLRKVGKKTHLVDSVYIDNAAEAHLLAADRLRPGSESLEKPILFHKGDPVDINELMSRIIATAGIPPIKRTVPPGFAYAVGWFFEIIYTLFRIKNEPPMTRFLAKQLSTAHWFDISAARQDLGYNPEISIEEGLKRLEQSFSDEHNLELINKAD